VWPEFFIYIHTKFNGFVSRPFWKPVLNSTVEATFAMDGYITVEVYAAHDLPPSTVHSSSASAPNQD
jgi:hypothetical protein